MRDPYLYPGTETLINHLGIQDSNKLQDLENAFYRVRLAEPLPVGDFDYDHLKAIHQHLFSDLYAWAGQERTVDIIKGHSHFARKEFISKELNKVFVQLKSDNYLQGLEYSDFCKKFSYYFNEINAAHPFREGNGRTLRAFCDSLAENAGYHLDWSRVTTPEYIQANIAGFNADYEAMETIFKKITSLLDRSRTLETTNIAISKDTAEQLKEYVDKQIQLTELVRQKNQFLVQDPELAKRFSQQAIALNQELKGIAKELTDKSDTQNLLKQTQIVSLQKQGGFAVIHERFQKNEMAAQDVLTVLRYAKGQAAMLSQSLNKTQDQGKRRHL